MACTWIIRQMSVSVYTYWNKYIGRCCKRLFIFFFSSLLNVTQQETGDFEILRKKVKTSTKKYMYRWITKCVCVCVCIRERRKTYTLKTWIFNCHPMKSIKDKPNRHKLFYFVLLFPSFDFRFFFLVVVLFGSCEFSLKNQALMSRSVLFLYR